MARPQGVSRLESGKWTEALESESAMMVDVERWFHLGSGWGRSPLVTVGGRIFVGSGGDQLACEDELATGPREAIPDGATECGRVRYGVELRYHRHQNAGRGRHSDGENDIPLHHSDDEVEVPVHHSGGEIEVSDHHSDLGIEARDHRSDVEVETHLMVWSVVEEECLDHQHSEVDECLEYHVCDEGMLIPDRLDRQGSLSGRRKRRDRFDHGCCIHSSRREGDVYSRWMEAAIAIWTASTEIYSFPHQSSNLILIPYQVK